MIMKNTVSNAAQWGRTASLLSALVVSLSACAKPHDNITTSCIGTDYRKTHPILVSEQTLQMQLLVDTDARGLSFDDMQRVEEFASRFKQAKGKVLRVHRPMESDNKAGIDRVLPKVLKVLKANGLSRRHISLGSYEEKDESKQGVIHLSYRALAASVHDCGNWEGDLTDNFANQNYGNFGCASQANFAAQLADPRDLVAPRAQGPIDAEQRANTIERYQTAPNRQAD